ncbi:MAG: ceramidase domain-containing protein [Sphingomonadales bacterium]|nr:ceramidase domain-containing protein [Sphingomonadales bacterium]
MTRRVIPALIPAFVLAILFLGFGPIAQPQAYHAFADSRGLSGIANFGNVVSNLAFLASGGIGLFICATRRPEGAYLAWTVFFAGVTLVSAGSATYHWAPDDTTLVWDRLPMTVGFMGAYAALLAEFLRRDLEKQLLVPALLMGVLSVLYWDLTGDLRLYFAVQATLFLTGLALLTGFRSEIVDKPLILAAFASYGAAFACEQLDIEIYALTGEAVSGHTLKHLFAALAPGWIAFMLAKRLAAAPTPS